MDSSRELLYKNLKECIGDTDLYEIQKIKTYNNNRIFCKEEWTNPTGSHYDRVYIRLLYQFEKNGKIKPGETHLVETTSGNAGIAFAWLTKELGYDATVIIPKDMPKIRTYEMKKYGTEVIYSEAGEYVKGVVKKLREYLIDYRTKTGKQAFCLDHSRREISYHALYSIAEEINEQLDKENLKPNYFIGAIGNGTTTAGIYNYFKNISQPIKMVGVEPIEAPVFFNKKYPGKFSNIYGHNPEYKPHKLIGSGGWGVKFPNVQLDTFEDIYLCSEKEWQEYSDLLKYKEKRPVGPTSAACLQAAVKLSEKIHSQNIFIFFYDQLWKYSDIFNGINK